MRSESAQNRLALGELCRLQLTINQSRKSSLDILSSPQNWLSSQIYLGVYAAKIE
ncbi:hypothetical protein C4K35_4137 [Pseudomonas chlororaphis subsp. piscium]|nr:hypothetical protein C4K35_4137 [Pseudomonas chlororaphis subsp. piscium]